MNDVYSMLNKAQQNTKNEFQMLSKEEYSEMMKGRREEAYKMSDEQALKLVHDPKSYLHFLEMMAKLDYTVTNTLLVMAQKPDATMLKDSSHWRNDNQYIKKGEKGIAILEPKGTYDREDGSIGTSYDVKYVFDVSQLSRPVRKRDVFYSTQELISGLVCDNPANMVMTRNNGMGTIEYSPNDKTIYYAEGLSPQELISGLARETCYAEIDSVYQHPINRDDMKFQAESAAYVLCMKYNIPVNDTSFANEVTDKFRDMDGRSIKEELSHIGDIIQTVDERMEKGIYRVQNEKEQVQKGNER